MVLATLVISSSSALAIEVSHIFSVMWPRNCRGNWMFMMLSQRNKSARSNFMIEFPNMTHVQPCIGQLPGASGASADTSAVSANDVECKSVCIAKSFVPNNDVLKWTN